MGKSFKIKPKSDASFLLLRMEAAHAEGLVALTRDHLQRRTSQSPWPAAGGRCLSINHGFGDVPLQPPCGSCAFM